MQVRVRNFYETLKLYGNIHFMQTFMHFCVDFLRGIVYNKILYNDYICPNSCERKQLWHK